LRRTREQAPLIEFIIWKVSFAEILHGLQENETMGYYLTVTAILVTVVFQL